jgi:hypothetical protein
VPSEQEPNDGPQVDTITAPGAKQGAIGTPNDVDIFTVTLNAGQQWRWTLDSQGSALAPHLSITEQGNSVPVLLARGTSGGSVTLEQLVLKSSTYAIIARDSRNVPAATSQNVGSPAHTYLLSSQSSARAPTMVSAPSTTPGALANRYASALYGLTLSTSSSVTFTVRAAAKTPPSDMDSRLTLFDKTRGQWAGTNDDVSASSTDSKLTGALQPGDYLVVVDNVSETANDLSFELVVSSP